LVKKVSDQELDAMFGDNGKERKPRSTVKNVVANRKLKDHNKIKSATDEDIVGWIKSNKDEFPNFDDVLEASRIRFDLSIERLIRIKNALS
jgi:hypothetical protein